MDRYRYFIFNQRSMVVLGILQMACAGLCVVCGFMDAAFRKNTTLSSTRAPLWAGMGCFPKPAQHTIIITLLTFPVALLCYTVMGVPGVLALFSSQRKNPILVNAMIAVSVLSCFTTLIVAVYAILTLSYGEDDDELFHPSHVEIPKAKFILSRLVKGANATMLLSSSPSRVAAAYLHAGAMTAPQEALFSQDASGAETEFSCMWKGGDDRQQEEEEDPSTKPPPYIRLA